MGETGMGAGGMATLLFRPCFAMASAAAICWRAASPRRRGASPASGNVERVRRAGSGSGADETMVTSVRVELSSGCLRNAWVSSRFKLTLLRLLHGRKNSS
jgi:hypothetical protein